MSVKFKATEVEITAIRQIAERMGRLKKKFGIAYPRLSLVMDLHATHCNGCPLQLNALAVAADEDFAHDLLGIQRHLDRTTGKLMHGFTPRYARPMKTYRLGSNEFLCAPGVIRFAMAGYRHERDRAVVVEAVRECWKLTDEATRALLSGEVPYTIEGAEDSEVVVFTF